MTNHAVLVTGGRDYDDERTVQDVVSSFPSGTLVIHGAARGADTAAGSACRLHGYPQAAVPYFGWMGRAGGVFRNQTMVDIARSLKDAGWKVKVVAFPGGSGTEDCVRRAKEAGLPVHRVHDHVRIYQEGLRHVE